MYMERKLIRCVIFDLDGTLFDAPYNWTAIKKVLEVPEGETILSYIARLPEQLRLKKTRMLEAFEEEATKKGKLKDGAKELLKELKLRGIKRVLVTNNLLRNTRYIIRKYRISFDMVITREMGMVKPGDAAIHYILENFSLNKEGVILVGDSDYDVKVAELSELPLIILGGKPLIGNFIRAKNITHLAELLLQGYN